MNKQTLAYLLSRQHLANLSAALKEGTGKQFWEVGGIPPQSESERIAVSVYAYDSFCQFGTPLRLDRMVGNLNHRATDHGQPAKHTVETANRRLRAVMELINSTESNYFVVQPCDDFPDGLRYRSIHFHGKDINPATGKPLRKTNARTYRGLYAVNFNGDIPPEFEFEPDVIHAISLAALATDDWWNGDKLRTIQRRVPEARTGWEANTAVLTARREFAAEHNDQIAKRANEILAHKHGEQEGRVQEPT